MVNELYDRDKKYWNEFYTRDKGDHRPSLFAEFIRETYILKNDGGLLELGCGNGRDSEYFIKQGIEIVAVDASDAAIDCLCKKYKDNSRATFICGDFVSMSFEEKYKYCYSRFSMHAISQKQEEELIKRVSEVIENEGYFFIEVRSINDELYGKGVTAGEDAYIYNGHYRRFIRMGELISRLEKAGFLIDYAAEKRGFAPHEKEDPYIIRIIGKKIVGRGVCTDNEIEKGIIGCGDEDASIELCDLLDQ